MVNGTKKTPNTGVRGRIGFAPGNVPHDDDAVAATSQKAEHLRADIKEDEVQEDEVHEDEVQGDEVQGDAIAEELAEGQGGEVDESEKTSTLKNNREQATTDAIASLHKQIESAMCKLQGPIETMAAQSTKQMEQEMEKLSDMSNLVKGLRSEVKRVTVEQQKSQQLQVMPPPLDCHLPHRDWCGNSFPPPPLLCRWKSLSGALSKRLAQMLGRDLWIAEKKAHRLRNKESLKR